MAKKINPRRRPMTQADLERAKKDATEFAVQATAAIFLTVLVDKEQADMECIKRVWGEVCDLSDSVNKGFVTVADLRNTLKEEMGVFV